MSVVLWLCGTALALAQNDNGRLEGRITLDDGQPVRYAAVVIPELGESTLTDARGEFVFAAIPAGTYRVEFTSGPNAEEDTLSVERGATSRMDKVVDWNVFFESTVVSASRRRESIVDAPAAITSMGAEAISRRVGVSGVPELLEFAPGVELTQQDINSFNFNTRGFNNTLTRRVAVFVDGRYVASPYLGSTNWALLPSPLEDYETVELVRGPSAALYGANASSGVLSMTTKAPRDSLGMSFRVTAGERETATFDGRFAIGLGDGWYLKLTGRASHYAPFAVARTNTVEYSEPCPPGVFGDCLPLDAFDVEPGNTSSHFSGGARLDKYFGGDGLLTLEGATSRGNCCEVVTTGVGRFLLTGPGGFTFARVNLDWGRYNVLAYYNDSGGPSTGGGGGGTDRLQEEQFHVEAQGDWELDAGRWVFVAGGFYENSTLDGYTARPIEANRQAVYAQADRELRPGLNFIVTGRLEDGSVHDLQLSPRASIVWAMRPDHSLRFSYNQAFQAPALVEVFLETPAAPPADLTQLNGLCLANGFSCGLGSTPVLALGNPTLGVETVRSFEIGYRGLIAGRTYVTIDAFVSRNKNFITNLLPQVGTPFGRLNPEYGPWAGPPEAESTPIAFPGCPGAATVADCIRGLVPPLSNDPDGANVIGALSFTNFGAVDTRGIELGVTHALTRAWRLEGAANWFDYDLDQQLPGFPDLLRPNAPTWQLAAGASYNQGPWYGSLRGRFVDAFRWSTGIFIGDVESYVNVDLDAHYRITPELKLGVSVSNLFDDQHYQFFGAPLLGRRAVVHFTFSR